MRALLAGTVLTLLLLSPVRAEPVPYEATIALPKVAVRSGPSPKFYVTGKLARNDRVRVLDERGDWLAIAPPKGSFSWINSRLIERTGHTAVVLADDAPTRVGSGLLNALPDVEGSKLKRGTLVLIKPGPPAEDSTGIWYAIEPPAQEVRYLPKTAVHVTPAVERLSSGNGSSDPLWQQAEQAERQGNILDAQRLYNQFAQQSNDHELQMRAYNRIEFLKQGQRISTPPNYQPGRPEAQANPQFPAYQPPRPLQAQPTGQTSAYPSPGMAPQPAADQPGPAAHRRLLHRRQASLCAGRQPGPAGALRHVRRRPEPERLPEPRRHPERRHQLSRRAADLLHHRLPGQCPAVKERSQPARPASFRRKSSTQNGMRCARSVPPARIGGVVRRKS